MSKTSVILGAGFSAPIGYPTAAGLSDIVVGCEGTEFGFHTSGQLAMNRGGGRPDWGYRTSYDIQFDFTLDLIKAYKEDVGEFNYEDFYDFIQNVPEDKQNIVDAIASQHLGAHYDTTHSLLSGVPNIFNQMVSHYLKDAEGNQYYDNQGHMGGSIFPGYTGILNCFSKLMEDNGELEVHTLNHDLFFERLNYTDWFSGEVADGFEELGSPYFGKLKMDNRSYMIRLPYYTGKYNGRCRLYKLHGSKDYVRYFFEQGGLTVPEAFIKTKYGVGFTDFYKEFTDPNGDFKYHNCWINYHSVYLTGTESKIEHYKDPLLFSKLFKHFEDNMKNSDALLICGYGGRDRGVNEIVLKHFDHENKPVYIIDPYPGDALKDLAARTGGKIIEKTTDNVELSDIDL